MTRKYRVYDLRNYRVVKAHHARKKRFAPVELAEKIGAKLFFQAPSTFKLIEISAGA